MRHSSPAGCDVLGSAVDDGQAKSGAVWLIGCQFTGSDNGLQAGFTSPAKGGSAFRGSLVGQFHLS
jgi:hypothetical protein